ncbi:MAG: bifunctional (p)ppGpp synthetase/guanosine-3',5'-bis(diphosphate) 3'-pyrophosphohydrolase, partial [Oscillospiraceae bacterium]|nr:bifunctional (p)ppGpp synthetase/guanosine-3',5'-bis(diphosphate) 3'-pyrophosphohydrolase [Oscillospiraceae bacterium]
MELVSEAVVFAVTAHDGMRRKKSESPYILHPMEAAVIVGTMTDDQNLIAAAALHDVVEDAGITIDEIEERFGKRVRELVASETEDKR